MRRRRGDRGRWRQFSQARQLCICRSQLRKVHVLVRSGNLSDTMSRYLIQRIEENPSIELHYKTEIVGMAAASIWNRSPGAIKQAARFQATTFAMYSLWPGHRRARNGCGAAWLSTRKGSLSPAAILMEEERFPDGPWADLHKCWRRAFRECLPWATFARAM